MATETSSPTVSSPLKLHRPLSIPERIREAVGVRVLVLSEAEALQYVPNCGYSDASRIDPASASLFGPE